MELKMYVLWSVEGINKYPLRAAGWDRLLVNAPSYRMPLSEASS